MVDSGATQWQEPESRTHQFKEKYPTIRNICFEHKLKTSLLFEPLRKISWVEFEWVRRSMTNLDEANDVIKDKKKKKE